MADADIPLPDEGRGAPADEASDIDSRNMSEASGAGEDGAQSALGSEGDEGEDLLDNAQADYRPMQHLDRYEREGIDADFEDDMDAEAALDARARAERDLDRRDVREGRMTGRRRLPGALEEDMDEDDLRPRRRRRVDDAQAGDLDDENDADVELGVNLEDQHGPAAEWVAQEPNQRAIAKKFKNFLFSYGVDGNERIYWHRLRAVCRSNKQSLEVSYMHLSAALPILAVWTADVPKQMLDIYDRVVKEVALEMFAGYADIVPEMFVRIADLPIADSIRDLRQFHLNQLVRLTGVVTRRSGVFPQLQQVKYDCLRCGFTLGPFFQNMSEVVKPASCPACQAKGPFEVNTTETVYRNYQKLTLQESPGSVQAGRLPRHKEVILLHDLIDCARPGEEIQVTGVYTNNYDPTLNARNGFPVFSTLVEANHVAKTEDLFAAYKLTDEDKHDIHKHARDPRIGERICKSIAPSIYGHLNIKTGIALALFGGQEKHSSGTHRLRGDINMLLLGDPGTAKSQFLKYVEKVAQRAVYTTGKGASAVGLTAAVHKDPITREWTLEGGALVLADRGVCLIDEFDKMNDQDRVSIHEAMEQQSISISKAGIVTQLQARCSVIAAANPIGGRYDSSRTFAENVELSDPILSRCATMLTLCAEAAEQPCASSAPSIARRKILRSFDCLCVVKDTVDRVADERLANFVVGSHRRSHPNQAENAQEAGASDPDILPQSMLRKYITYAKQTCRPKLQNADYDKIATVYAELRRESAISHGMPIAVRHLESMIRMAEAHAAMHLREYVNDDDIDTAIRVLLDSFISTQKQSVQRAMAKKFRKYVSYKRDFHDLVMASLQGLLRDQLRREQVSGLDQDRLGPAIAVQMRALQDAVKDYGVMDLTDFLGSTMFQDSGFSLDASRQLITFPR